VSTLGPTYVCSTKSSSISHPSAVHMCAAPVVVVLILSRIHKRHLREYKELFLTWSGPDAWAGR
jgi:hypothetical protein